MDSPIKSPSILEAEQKVNSRHFHSELALSSHKSMDSRLEMTHLLREDFSCEIKQNETYLPE